MLRTFTYGAAQHLLLTRETRGCKKLLGPDYSSPPNARQHDFDDRLLKTQHNGTSNAEASRSGAACLAEWCQCLSLETTDCVKVTAVLHQEIADGNYFPTKMMPYSAKSHVKATPSS